VLFVCLNCVRPGSPRICVLPVPPEQAPLAAHSAVRSVLARDVRVINPSAPKVTRHRLFANSVLAVEDARQSQRR
jgi:hypothetical protein